MATLTCRCGAVEVRFNESKPRAGYGCCCVDCRQKCIWANAKGGPALPAAVLRYEKPLELRYMSNRFVMIKGEDNVDFFKLRDGCRSTNCVSTCCFTTLLVDNPGYQEKSVLIFPEICKLQTELPLEPITFIGFANDFPKDKLAALPPGDSACPLLPPCTCTYTCTYPC
jgi:hypothetical protein